MVLAIMISGVILLEITKEDNSIADLKFWGTENEEDVEYIARW